MSEPIRKTLSHLAGLADGELAAAVLATGLAEPEVADATLHQLLSSPAHRAPREILRGFHHLSEEHRRRAVDAAEERLRRAAEQLVRSDRARTRANLALFTRQVVRRAPERWGAALPLLLLLVDDPHAEVRGPARDALLAGLERCDLEALQREMHPRHPLIGALRVLLRHHDPHGDETVVTSLLRLGPHGADSLAHALGEGWPSAACVRASVREESRSRPLLAGAAEALFRWLRSPFPAARECARKALRERTDAPFLEVVLARLVAVDGHSRQSEFPIYRHLRWELLPAEVLRTLDDATQERLAGYIQAAPGTQEQRSQRLVQLLPAVSDSVRRQILHLLREHATPGDAAAVAAVASSSDDPQVQMLAADLLGSDTSRPTLQMLIRQLASPAEEVRSAAQRHLSGHGLDIFLERFDDLAVPERRRLFGILARIDLHFEGQLRRTLRTGRERDVVRCLRAVIEGGEVGTLEEALLDLTVSPSPRVRATLTRAMAQVSREPGLHYLRLSLDDADARVRANSVEVLETIDDPRARTWIAECCEDPAPRVRANGLLALARRGNAEARARLERLATPRSDPAAPSARWALTQLER